MPEHAVIINFKYGSGNLGPLFELERELERAIGNSKVGEYDGNEVAVDGSEATLYAYGPDADKLFEIIEPVLRGAIFLKAATVRKCYGPPEDDAQETTVTISF